jgi:nitric oxide dioxygenase
MLGAALAAGRPVHFIHCARNAAVHAFRDLVDDLAVRHPQLRHFYCYDDAGATAQTSHTAHAVGRLDQARLAAWLPADRDVDAYFLGPLPFMASVKASLKALGVPESQTRYEFFGPAAELA